MRGKWVSGSQHSLNWFLPALGAVSLLHPDTLSGNFTKLIEQLKIEPYIFHDLRRAFITNAIRKGVEPEDLRLAVAIP